MSTNLAISGLASGFDWQTLVDQLVQVERTPETNLQKQQSQIQQQNNALGSIKTELSVLQNKIQTLQDPAFFDTRIATPSDTSMASATAAEGTAVGTYSFNVSQLATAAAWKGATGIGAPLSSTDDVSALALETAGFGTAVTAGTFTVNGKQITIATTDTLQSVFDQISSATGGAVTAGYSSATDKITLSSSSEIVLGSAADTSNFLQVAKLSNNTTGTITSSAELGAVNVTGSLSDANFATAVSDGGSGAGAFKINGVTINFSASADSIANVISRINDSAAGVVASYDPTSDRLTLTNKTTGDIGIAVEDVTGNFAAATGLTAGSLTHGKNLLYTIDNGPQFSSQTNTITGDSSGLTGLSVTALAEGTFNVTVAADTATIKTAITDFVSQYNKVQSLIDSQTASTTDSTGKVTAGILTGDQDAENINSHLRNLMTGSITGLSGTLTNLDSLGFASNGNDDSLSTSDTSGLDDAMVNNLSGLKELFTNSTNGLGVQVNTYLDSTIGDDGSLVVHQNSLTQQSANIDTQISTMERWVLAYQQQLTDSFVAMETAQQNINTQLAFLQKQSFWS